ncbi:DUF882 domain-containing protein [Thiohalomonas denitrificans]|uniref:DUF882 domain-containing protein n=1 Tax=Thiohalomonas denitrificans TaxID=415747 RepID=UPI0026F01C6A|nr:DUF882 domain-containing protein [Thiohalomonas denitrificans]
MPNRIQRNRVDRGRRGLLKAAAACATTVITPPVFSATAISAREENVRELAFYGLHTGESLRTPYWEEGHYLPEALEAVDFILRDHRSSEVKRIDPGLLDLLWAMQQRVPGQGTFHVISGYRSPSTNEALRAASGGIAKYSLHKVGKAIDIRLPGTPTRRLKQVAVVLKRGGVGYYPESDFVHVDTGRVRYW